MGNKLSVETEECFPPPKHTDIYTDKLELLSNFVVPGNEHLPAEKKLKVLTVVLVGKTGSGKSATGNTLAGEHVFPVSASSESYTAEIKVHEFEYNKRRIRIVDSPGLADTRLSLEETHYQIAKVIDECPGGVHAFLYTHSSTECRYTAEQRRVTQSIEEVFGGEIFDHTVMILTYAMAKFGTKSLLRYLEEDVHGDFATLIKEKLGYRVVAVENSFTGWEERQRMRQSILNVIDKLQKDVQFSTYTRGMFEFASVGQKRVNELKACHFAALRHLYYVKFQRAYTTAKHVAKQLACQHFRNIGFWSGHHSDSDRSLLKKYLMGGLKEGTRRQFYRLALPGGADVLDHLVTQCLHVGGIAYEFEKATVAQNEVRKRKYERLLRAHEICEKECVSLVREPSGSLQPHSTNSCLPIPSLTPNPEHGYTNPVCTLSSKIETLTDEELRDALRLHTGGGASAAFTSRRLGYDERARNTRRENVRPNRRREASPELFVDDLSDDDDDDGNVYEDYNENYVYGDAVREYMEFVAWEDTWSERQRNYHINTAPVPRMMGTDENKLKRELFERVITGMKERLDDRTKGMMNNEVSIFVDGMEWRYGLLIDGYISEMLEKTSDAVKRHQRKYPYRAWKTEPQAHCNQIYREVESELSPGAKKLCRPRHIMKIIYEQTKTKQDTLQKIMDWVRDNLSPNLPTYLSQSSCTIL